MRLQLIAVFALVFVSFGAFAQSVTLLSSTANTTDGPFGGTPDSADHFTTGSVGLTLTSIGVLWVDAGSAGVNQVGIYTESGGFPSETLVGSFFTNTNPTATGLMTYTGSATLQANTTYWVVLDITDNADVAFTNDSGFFADPVTQGASILDNSAFGDNMGMPIFWISEPQTLQFELTGTADAVASGAGSSVAVPTLPFYGLVLTALGLLLIVNRRQRASSKRD